jgi:hypothetical protein
MITLHNLELQKIIEHMAIHIHEQAVQIRKDYEILPGMIKLYADFAIYCTDDNKYFSFHYVVYVDNKGERFHIVTWTPATQDEFLDSIN